MNAVESLSSKMFDVIKKCIGKQVILYGYGKSGIFIEWLCSHVYGKKFALVIDDKKVIPGISLHRKIILDYIDPNETVILVSFRRERMTENDMSQMTAYGYEEGKNLFYLKDMIIPDTLGLYSFLEHECGTDFLKRVDQSEFDSESPDATACGASRERSLFDMCQMPRIFNGKVLDFGCGKGAAIAIMKMAGIKEVDGVEQSHMLAEIARDNMKKLGEDMGHKELNKTVWGVGYKVEE